MPVRIVQSKQNSRLKELRRAFTHPARAGHGLVAIEGPNLVGEAVRAAVRIECIFVARETEHHVARLPLHAETEVVLLPADILAAALATETPQPIAALIEPPLWTWSDLLGKGSRSAPLILVFAELQDPGNLGTILRSAEAFGASGIISLPGTVSAWNPKALRASAGSVFRLPLLNLGVTDALRHLRKSAVNLLATTPRSARPADQLDLSGPVALLIGNEGSGVPGALAAEAHEAITIPCPGPVESLNAAVAASVLLYEASRQRSMTNKDRLNPQGGRE